MLVQVNKMKLNIKRNLFHYSDIRIGDNNLLKF